MRISVMVLGILFAIWIFFEAMIVTAIFSAGDSEEAAGAGGIAILVAIIIGVGASLALSVPHISMVLFLLGSVLSFIAASSGYATHWFYAVVILMLALFSFFGRRGQLRDRREKAAERDRQIARDQQLDDLMRRQVAPPGE